MAIINGDNNDNILIGTNARDSILGFDGNDFLDGRGGNDTLGGGKGDDFLAINDGVSFFNGGEGFDTVGIASGFLEGLQTLTPTTLEIDATVTNGLINITLFSIEKAKLRGNFIDASAAQIPVDMIGGFNGVQTVLRGGSGNDTISSGNNDDFIDAGNGNNRVESFDGKDTILSGSGSDTLLGGNGDDFMDAGDGNDSLEGGDGNDQLLGGIGADVMKGGNGNDTYAVDNVGDQVIESSAQGGIDTVNSFVSFTLSNNLERLVLAGSSNINGTGNSLNNFIAGNVGNNILNGGDGDDFLISNTGNDTLLGGNGVDRFVFAAGQQFSSTLLGVDTLKDFAHKTDKIVLDKEKTFTALKSVVGIGFSLGSEFAVVNSDNAASTSRAVIVYNSSNGNLFYNQNGTAAGFGSGAQFATLENKPTLSASDFVLQTNANLDQLPSKPIINGSSKGETLTGTDLSGILNGFGGNDKLFGKGGDDDIFGGDGKDIIYAGTGADFVEGNTGNDNLFLGIDNDIDTVVYRAGDGKDVIHEFNRGAGGDQLQFEGIAAVDVISNGCSTFFRLGDGILSNKGFGGGQLLAELHHTTGFTAGNMGLNVSSGNQAKFLFG